MLVVKSIAHSFGLSFPPTHGFMFSKITAWLRDSFGFSQRETRGFLLLLFLIGLCLLAPFAYKWILPDKPRPTTAADQRQLDSLLARVQIMETKRGFDTQSERDRPTGDRYAEPRKLFRFDPNTASVGQWQQLGLPRYMAERIDKYRSKGGKFRRREDLLKIYDFPPDLYDQLEPYISLPQPAPGNRFGTYPDRPAYASNRPGQPDNRPGSNPGGYPDRPPFEKRPPKPVQQPFDINSADTTQLIALKGIGSTRARQIVKYRDALGGFVSEAQFADIFNIDSLSISELQQYAKIRTPARKIAINTATPEELDRSPYLSRRQAEIIIKYREQHGAYTSIESLKPIKILDAKLIEKLGPYLSF
jgi:competence protein ComEA